jgi:hypothetical protein
MVGSSREEGSSTTSIAIIAVVAALALLGVVVTVAVTIPLQQADAARPVGAGCPGTSPAANASKTRCFAG